MDLQTTMKEGEELFAMKLGHAKIRRHNIPQVWKDIPSVTEPFDVEVTLTPMLPKPRFSQAAVFAMIMLPAIALSVAVILATMFLM